MGDRTGRAPCASRFARDAPRGTDRTPRADALGAANSTYTCLAKHSARGALMSYLVLTLTVAVLNLCLGYLVAVRLGYGPPTVRDDGERGHSDGAAAGARAGHPAATAPPADARIEPIASVSLEEMLAEPDDDPFGDGVFSAFDDHDAEAAEGYVSNEPECDYLEIWNLNEKFVETSILKLNVAMMKSGAKAKDLDTRLRAAQGRPDAETIRACLGELVADCESYLAEQSEAAERFAARIEELGELRSLGERIEMANMEQAAQIETTLSNLRFMDLESDPEAAKRRLLEEIKNLRAARHRLRDDQERAFLAIARYEGRMAKIETRLFHDSLTRLRNRIGLETTLWQWWQEGRHRTKQLCAALFDVDGFGQLNEDHGLMVADRILDELGQILERSADECDLVGRFAGQQFLLVAVNAGRARGTKSAEMIRQSIERTTFLNGQREIRVTVGIGISEASPDDTDEALLARLEKALRRAKAVGPNRSFYVDERTAELVEAPNLGAKYTEIAV